VIPSGSSCSFLGWILAIIHNRENQTTAFPG